MPKAVKPSWALRQDRIQQIRDILPTIPAGKLIPAQKLCQFLCGKIDINALAAYFNPPE